MAKYKILIPTGVDYPDPKAEGKEKHAKAGAIVEDLPASSIDGLLQQEYIQDVKEDKA